MPARLFVVTVVFLAFAGQAAVAIGAEVSVRVEGLTRTIFEGRIDTTVHPVNGGDGSGPHVCSGPFGETASTSLTGALDDALSAARIDWLGEWDPSAGDFLITSIGREEATPARPWSTLLNGEPTPTGGCSTRVRAGDRVLLAYDVVFKPVSLALSGPVTAETGEEFVLVTTDERTGGDPVPSATIAGAGLSAVSGPGGQAKFTVDQPGEYTFKAEHPEAVRSNAVTVCVGIESPGCGSGPGPGLEGPATRIAKIAQGQKFLRGAGPRILRGRVTGASRVQVAIRRTSGKHRQAGLVWKAAKVDGGKWSRRIGPKRPGRYRLFSRAAGTGVAQPWVKAVNRVDFIIRHKRLDRTRLKSGATRYLRRAAATRTVRSSKLLRGWTNIALGKRVRGARLLVGGQLGDRLEDGSFGGDLNRTAMAVIATSGRRPAVAGRAATWIVSRQNPDGGFGFSDDASSDADSSGLAAWALALAGRWLEVRDSANFIRRLQNPDGGFPAIAGGESNSQSTGLALVALRMAGRAPGRVRTEDGITPLHYLAGLQRTNGAINYAPGLAITPSWVTAQARLGLNSRAGLLPG